jgi:hypothetical protein
MQIWSELQLPKLNLRDPWYGRTLGQWTAEEEEAELALKGRHYETGEKQRKARRSFPLKDG